MLAIFHTLSSKLLENISWSMYPIKWNQFRHENDKKKKQMLNIYETKNKKENPSSAWQCVSLAWSHRNQTVSERQKPTRFPSRSVRHNFLIANKRLVQARFAGCKRRLSFANKKKKKNQQQWLTSSLSVSRHRLLLDKHEGNRWQSIADQSVSQSLFSLSWWDYLTAMKKHNDKTWGGGLRAANRPTDMLKEVLLPTLFFTDRGPRNPNKCFCTRCFNFLFGQKKQNKKKQHKKQRSFLPPHQRLNKKEMRAIRGLGQAGGKKPTVFK